MKEQRRHESFPLKRDEAAGGVVAERGPDGVRIVLIATARGGSVRWSLPKGHFKRDETNEQAALREVREETGLEVDVVARLATIDYWFVEKRTRYHKFVHYFLMRATGGRLDDHDHEVVEARWFPLEEALERMAYPNERAMLEERREVLHELLAGSPAGADAARQDRER